MITVQDIEELKEIAREDYGVEITDEQAREEGERWVLAIKAIINPLSN